MICYNCDGVIKEAVRYKNLDFCSTYCMNNYRSAEHIDCEKLGKQINMLMTSTQFEKKKRNRFI
jgi:hypothetical protein